MRSDLENNKARDLDIRSTRLGVQRTPLTGDLILAEDSPLTNYFDPNGADRIITLPAKDRGLYFIIFNVGSANTLTVKDDLGNTLIALTTIEGASFFCSGREWRYLSGVTGSSIAAELTSLDNTITLTANPTTVDLAVNEPQVDHNLLLNYVADQHVAHSGVTITAGVGLAGGGNIAANRTIDLDLSDLVADTPVLGDTFAFFDVSGGDTNKATLTTLNSILDHDALVGFVANEHIDHTTVSITAGTGLTGGGTIAANRTISLDINGLSSDSPVGTDLLAFYDASGADHNKATISAIFAMMLPGADTQIVFNDAGVFGADPGLTYNKATDTLGLSTGSVISFNAGDVTITHAANTLSFAGASTGYNLDALTTITVAGNTARHINNTNAASVQVASFEGDRSAPAANDAAYISLMLSDSVGTQTEFARLTAVATTVTNLSEAGALDFGVMSAGTFVDHVRLNSTTFRPIGNDTHTLGSSGSAWSDLFLASGGVINFNSGDVTITHSANLLAFAGASSGYTYDALNTITAASSSALTVGRQGETDPVLKVNTATASAVTGIEIIGAAAAGRVNLAAISSDVNEGLSINAKGSGTIRLGPTSTGAIEFSRNAVPTTSDGASLGTSALMWSDAFFASGGVLNWNAGNYTITHSAGDLAFSGIVTLPNSGLHLLDTNASHDLIITPGSDLTLDRVLTLTTGDAARTVTISGNTTISQDYSTTGNPQFATIELGAATDTTLARSSAGNMSIEGNVVYRAGGTDVPVADGGTGASDAATARTNLGVPYGKQSIWIPATAMNPRTTNGAVPGSVEMTTNKNMVKTLDFDSATQEFAQFDVRMPKSWDESTVTFIPVWSHPATVTNFGVVWGLDAVAVSNDDALDVAFGTAQTSVDTGGTTNDSYQGPESSAITIAGTPAEGDLVQFRIHRDPANGSDTMAVDARLHGILLLFTNNNTNDT